ncbi:hypothetical protein B296_00008442 [Ensete ventricosum]|uniref:Uncharacterized protein n=1 Tax=Ensete ventricosum TaxID=4639 RepID=A0A427APZ9_ENSVE|nr:hypothetical protein B296_00008442 [Ensete ventricosum]
MQRSDVAHGNTALHLQVFAPLAVQEAATQHPLARVELRIAKIDGSFRGLGLVEAFDAAAIVLPLAHLVHPVFGPQQVTHMLAHHLLGDVELWAQEICSFAAQAAAVAATFLAGRGLVLVADMAIYTDKKASSPFLGTESVDDVLVLDDGQSRIFSDKEASSEFVDAEWVDDVLVFSDDYCQSRRI